ncbi:aldehyde dehydrogenase (NADP(+)) [Stappia sp.]|uniref:aldehyde dehydrogenase (NADP(+)) n=1 Tax=Stappia sp. TaxID=1870903 RepID=UPI003A9A548F
MLNGHHLVNGTWVASERTFAPLNPATGEELSPRVGDADAALVGKAAEAAEAAFADYAARPASDRAAFLRRIADEIEARGAEITERAQQESALPAARLEGERGRTTGQLRFFADWIEAGICFDARVDTAQPDRKPAPRPEIRSILRPLGPVAVFGASNFPLAFSTAGGDTASALAAGCPVVVKGHPAHPGTSEIVAQAILVAIEACGMPAGVFNLVQGSGHEAGGELVRHPLIQAVGFTGSLRGGRALFDMAVSRPQPIPFYGELGSVNPVFALPGALGARGAELGAGWAQSLTMGVGQFCTNPGVVVALEGAGLSDFLQAADEALTGVSAQSMLTGGIAKAYRASVGRLTKASGVTGRRIGEEAGGSAVLPAVFEVSAETWLSDSSLHEEMFGPAAVVVRCKDTGEMADVARGLEGQLTATVLMEDGDLDAARALVPVLERKAGRLLRNGFSTGVEVSHAMMHGGPYPASTDVRSTSVGSRAIDRFLRPVAYQNFLEEMLPEGLGGNDGGPRLVDGKAHSGT